MRHTVTSAVARLAFSYNATTMQQSAALLSIRQRRRRRNLVFRTALAFPSDTDATRAQNVPRHGNNGPVTSSLMTHSPQAHSLAKASSDISSANGGLTPTDAFTSFNSEKLDDGDLDQGSAAFSWARAAQSNPPILIEAGKRRPILVLNRNNLAE